MWRPSRAEETGGIRARLREQLAPLGREEIDRGTSLLGPHRDDLRFLVNGVDMTIYGSRGQQRTAALGAKLAEVEWLHAETGEMPILLLDDMISELDLARRNFLARATLNRASRSSSRRRHWRGIPPSFLQRATLLRVEQGQIEALT